MKITNKTDISLIIRRLIRKAANAPTNCPISIIEGCSPPAYKGSPGHFENKSGDLIRYPSAYKKAWGKPTYIRSTRRVEVGADWLLNSLSLYNIKLLKLKAFI